MADPTKKTAADLTPEDQGKIEAVILGTENLKGLRSPEAVQDIIDVLEDEDESASFLEQFKRIGKIIDKMELDPEERAKADKKVTMIIMAALEKNQDKIEQKIDALKNSEEKARKKLQEHVDYREGLKEITERLRNGTIDAAAARNERIALKKAMVEDVLDFDEKVKTDRALAEALKALIELIENPPDHISDLSDELAALEKATEEKKKKKAEEEAKKKEEEEKRKGVPRYLEVKEPEAFDSPEDIRNAEMKWADVVNDLGRKPRPSDSELFWKPNAKQNKPEPLSEAEIASYRKFLEFMKGVSAHEKSIADELKKISIPLTVDAGGKKVTRKPEELNPLFEEAAEMALRTLLKDLPAKDAALLYYVLGVSGKTKAFDKLLNVIKLEAEVNVPGRTAVYEEKRDKDGNIEEMSMTDFVKKNHEYGERMVTAAYDVLNKLYKKYASSYPDLDVFREILIGVIKTRGRKDLDIKGTKVGAAAAKEIYGAFLIMKDEHVVEKEILALLIGLKANPPFVYDLINTTDGWVKGDKKTGMYVLEDFAIDGSIYLELKEKLGLSTAGFNKFIIAVAPVFERVRSLIASKKDAGAEVTLGDITAVIPGFTAEHLAIFKKMMDVPLWPDKVGHAFKYALYLEDDGGRKVPIIKEIQGPETKDINVTFVNVEEKLRRIADRLADERLDQELKEIGPQGWKELWRLDKIACKWWKRNAAEGYRDKYRREYMQRLKEDPKYRTELMKLPRTEVRPGGLAEKMKTSLPAEGTRKDLGADLDAIAERFGIAWETGDTESYLTENERTPENLDNLEVQNAIKKLCMDFENNVVDENGFKNRMKNEIIPMVQALQDPPDSAVVAFLEENGHDKTDIDKLGLLDKMKAHKAGLIALDLNNLKVHLRIGKAMNVDVKTQVKDLGWIDKASRGFVEGIQRNKFLGRFLSPGTVAVMGYGLGNIVGQVTTGGVARYGTLLTMGFLAPSLWPAVAGIGAACLIGGTFNAMRQRKEVMRLKAMKERREALGYRPEDDDKAIPLDPRFERRMEEAGALYDKVQADDLINNIESRDTFAPKVAALAEAIARNDISELGLRPGELENGYFFKEQAERVDLIEFARRPKPGEDAAKFSLEGQRLKLVRTIAEGKVALRRLGAPAGLDADRELAVAVANARRSIIENMREREKAFIKLKRWETVKAAGVGAAVAGAVSGIALGISHLAGGYSTTASQTINLTPAGPMTPAAFQNALIAYGVTPADASKIVSMAAFDPATGQITAASAAAIKSAYGINVMGMLTPGGITSIPVGLNGGLHMTQADLIKEVHAINPSISSQIQFDPVTGKLNPSSLAVLKANNFNVAEHVSTIPGGGSGPFTPGPGWSTISKLHFNDNMPHTPGWHVLDELRMWWNGKPGLGADGNYHFTVKSMFDPKLPHSHLPAGVSMPADPTGLKIGMQVNSGGTNYWKFFTPDASGDVKIPPQYFDPTHVGAVPKGGSVLPGLKTDAMAVMFEDSNGTHQVLASVRGQGGFTPDSTSVDFTGEFLKQDKLPDVTELGATAVKTETEYWAAAVPPVGVGMPMRHLEYGKEGEDTTTTPTPTPPTTPTPTPAPEPPESSGSDSGADSGGDAGSNPDTGSDTTGPSPEPLPPYIHAAVPALLKKVGVPVKKDAAILLTTFLNRVSTILPDEPKKIEMFEKFMRFLDPANLDAIKTETPDIVDAKGKIPAAGPLNEAGRNIAARFYKQEETFFSTFPDDKAFSEIGLILRLCAKLREIDLKSLT